MHLDGGLFADRGSPNRVLFFFIGFPFVKKRGETKNGVPTKEDTPMWVWVKIKPPGDLQVLVRSIHQGNPFWLPVFDLPDWPTGGGHFEGFHAKKR